MATLREFLEEEGFDFANGIIIIKDLVKRYEDDDLQSPGWCRGGEGKIISTEDQSLDDEFDSGYGGPECPRFVAEDAERIYFPSQYDGATRCVSVRKNVYDYLSEDFDTPYPGGG